MKPGLTTHYHRRNERGFFLIIVLLVIAAILLLCVATNSRRLVNLRSEIRQIEQSQALRLERATAGVATNAPPPVAQPNTAP